ncbi:hypothetical protein AZE42_08817 [Rhizopogon vesiculosus]|uniref:Uncharacterized protein n=1 Tax=Rhizopogon vesiculosus TaxID=180088 RepID=A0A1J8QH17_9AGAM|nr:hypothetical protein AZE42_08817 [Rhizopogon vesiculosus]
MPQVVAGNFILLVGVEPHLP